MCKHGTVSCYTICQIGAIVGTVTHKDKQQFGRQPSQHLTRQYCGHPRTSTHISSVSVSLFQIVTLMNLLRHTVTPKISPVTRHRTDHNKHNDAINFHAQNYCTHKLHIPKISQNVYKSKRNLEANDVQISHTKFTIIIADQLMVGQ